MLLPRSAALASWLLVLSGAALEAQGSADSTSRAISASERALGGRALARKTIAVLPFSVSSEDTTLAALGYGIAEFLSDDLAQSHRLTMIERFRLPDLQRETDLGDNADEATRVRIGRLVAAQQMIYGAIDVPVTGAVSVDARAVDVETSDIGMHASATSPLDAIFRAERDVAMQTFSAFGITLTADEKRALYERVAPQFRAFVAFSRGVRAEQQGNDDAAMASYQEAATLDRGFALAARKASLVRQRILAPVSATTSGARAAADAKPDAGGATRDPSSKAGASAPVSGSAPGGSSGTTTGGVKTATTAPSTTGKESGTTKDAAGTKKALTPSKKAHPRTPQHP